MSQTETIRGKIRLVKRADGESLNVACLRVIVAADKNTDLPDYYEDYVEYLRTEIDTHFVYKDELYEITEEEDLSDDDIFEANKNPDGTINFIVQYYNGSCGFHEAIQRSLDKLNEEK